MKLWTFWIIFFVLYLGLNAASVFLPYIPGMASFISWGAVLPTFSVIGWWIICTKRRGEVEPWWLPGVLATVCYVGTGIASVMIIGSIWAAV